MCRWYRTDCGDIDHGWRDITATEEEPSFIFNDDIKYWMNRDAKSREA